MITLETESDNLLSLFEIFTTISTKNNSVLLKITDSGNTVAEELSWDPSHYH